MKLFDISCDSNCDFYAQEINDFGIYVGALSYVLISKDGTISDCLDNFQTEEEYYEFYDKLRQGYSSKTSILSEEAHYELFSKMAKDGVRSALHICQSYGLSPTLDRAKDAYARIKDEYPDFNVVFVESSTTTIGEQMLVRVAIKCRDAGLTVEETAKKLESIKLNIQHYVVVSDLMYLKRGGRVSGPSAMIGTMLKVKPIIEFTKEGKLDIVAKKMGEGKAFSFAIEEGLEMGCKNEDFQILVAHTGNRELAEKLASRVQEAFGVKPEIRIIGPIIGTHLGPDAVAFAFIGDKIRKY